MKSLNNEDYSFIDKWSREVSQYNFTQVPNLLLGCQGHLQLTDGELLTLIHLLTFWFSQNGRVYPTISTLTKFSHKGYSTVQRRLRILEEKGFVKRNHKLGSSNTYDLTPSVNRLKQHHWDCVRPPRKQVDPEPISSSLHTSFSSNKEYKNLIILSSKNTENVRDVYSALFSEQSDVL